MLCLINEAYATFVESLSATFDNRETILNEITVERAKFVTLKHVVFLINQMSATFVAKFKCTIC